ncbi:hypothetical protein SAMN05661080_05101, partial [Modestobacter sp. DSM 44400]|uniref:hypothetical protein n=1 Tax=Modestobacter sp. DSM 44400 TaxID=1550230 RepID=UPI000899A8D1
AHGGPLFGWSLGGRPTPTSRPVQAGDRHLNFYKTRDNLSLPQPSQAQEIGTKDRSDRSLTL